MVLILSRYRINLLATNYLLTNLMYIGSGIIVIVEELRDQLDVTIY